MQAPSPLFSSANGAFDILRRASQRTNGKLRDIVADADPPRDRTLVIERSRTSALEAARNMLGLSVPELWLSYLGLGGNLLPAAISAALSGDKELADHDHDLLVQALNEHFADLDQGYPLFYADEIPLTTK